MFGRKRRFKELICENDTPLLFFQETLDARILPGNLNYVAMMNGKYLFIQRPCLPALLQKILILTLFLTFKKVTQPVISYTVGLMYHVDELSLLIPFSVARENLKYENM